MPKLNEALLQKVRGVKLLLMDCDGVLTDGRLYFTVRGEEMKVFHVRDGQGLVEWHKAGFRSGIISGRSSEALELRMRQLGVEFLFLKREDKLVALSELLTAVGVSANEVAYIGDDSPDIEVIEAVGFGVAVGDALDEVKAAADYVTTVVGGRGAVREVIDILLANRPVENS